MLQGFGTALCRDLMTKKPSTLNLFLSFYPDDPFMFQNDETSRLLESILFQRRAPHLKESCLDCYKKIIKFQSPIHKATSLPVFRGLCSDVFDGKLELCLQIPGLFFFSCSPPPWVTLHNREKLHREVGRDLLLRGAT